MMNWPVSKGAQSGAQAIRIDLVEQAFDRRMLLFPHRHGRDQQGVAGRGEGQTAAAFVGIIDGYGDQTAPLERLQIGGQCRAIHGKQGGNFPDARGLGAIEGHQQRELAVGEVERPQCRVKAPRHRPRGLLKVQTKAGVANPAGDIEGQRGIGY